MTYTEKRTKFFDQFPDFWNRIDVYNKDKDDYDQKEFAIYGHYPITKEFQKELYYATQLLGRVYSKAADLLRYSDDQFLVQLGLPEATVAYAKTFIPNMPETVVGRFDFAFGPYGLKMLEFNAETPTFIMETHKIGPEICKEFEVDSINDKLDAINLGIELRLAIDASLEYLGKEEGCIAFTSYSEHFEDYYTTQYIKSLVENEEYVINYVPLEELQIDNDGVYDGEGNRIDVLYHLYPTEVLVYDKDDLGRNIGQMLMNHVINKKLAVINPPSAFLMQSKCVQEVIWRMRNELIFTEKEQEAIKKYMLPTLRHPHELEWDKYVAKSSFGREGNTVQIMDGEIVLEASTDTTYEDFPMVYQKYVPLTQARFETEDGVKGLNLIISCFLIAGDVGAVGIRGSEGLITDNTSYFIPVSVS